MSFLRTTLAARPAVRLAARPAAVRPTPFPAAPVHPIQAVSRQSIRSYASQEAASPVHTHTPMWIVLGVLVAGGVAGYTYTKPIRELAEKAHAAIDTAKSSSEQASGLTSQVAGLAGLGPALAISQTLYAKVQEHGGVSQFVSGLSDDLKNADVDAAISKIKKVGGKDVEPYIAQVESALKEAKGKVQDVDWKSLLANIQDHVGDEWKGAIKSISDMIPASGPLALAVASGDWSKITEKIKAEGGDQLKELESTAKKLYEKASAINQDKKGSIEDFVKQLKDVDGEDLDKIVSQIKGVATKAGIPADQIESWIAAKGGKLDTEQLVAQAKSLVEAGQGKLEGATNLVDSDKVVGAVKGFSPALASLLALTLSQAGAKLGGEGKSAAKDGKAQFESTKKQIETLTSTLKSTAGGFSGDLEKRITNLSQKLQKTLDEAPSVESTANAAKDSAKSGEKTSSAESKQKEWEQAVSKMKEQVKKEVEGLYKDLEKEVGEGKKGEAAKKALDLAKGFLG